MTPGKLSTAKHCALAALWFAYNVQWSALIPVVLPAQVLAIAGQQHKELINGVAMAVGAVAALFTAPIAGALSDRSMNRRGRRRSFLIFGIAANILALGALAAIGPRGGITRFLVALLSAQFACNWWGGPYAGLIPDVAPAGEHGRASGYMMLMTGAGAIVGTGAAGPIFQWGGYSSVYLFLVLVLLLCGIATLAGVTEPPPESAATAGQKRFFQDFLPDPTQHRDFYIVLVTRACVTMGAFSTLPFFQYFFSDVMHDPKAILHGSLLLGAVATATLPIALAAGKQADCLGPRPIVWISGWIMAGATAIYIVDCFLPSWPFTIVMGLIFSAGSVAYQAVDWALALSVLPDSHDPGKDMGIWHIALVLPQAIAPLISGAVLEFAKKFSKPGAYAAVFAITAIWYALGTAPIRTLRPTK